ncbi:BnaA06g19500D [Brassica napus]|uniref:(rape) hypothetical protein n=1 Tax=Brassica napus TaxID=3708 RepID=A0A078GVC4_BRANA|nr:unnamed protein product [Brassica napus]CDY28588.1 BnaA06g19500D [Brassica napus]
MATGVAYDDWSRRCVSSSPIHIYICEDESDTGDEQAREMRNKVMKLMVVNDKPENFFQVFTLTARFSEGGNIYACTHIHDLEIGII